LKSGNKTGKGGKEMTDERMKALAAGRKIGALIGAIVFLVFGIVPAFYFGSFGTLVMITHLAGGPVEAGIIVRMLVVVWVVVGLFCTAAVSIVAGSVVGTALAYVADLFRVPSKVGEKATAAE
jgi:uncharacterized membrane protein (DUF485 family)